MQSSPALATTITSAGPLTRIEISPTLNCSVNHVADADPEFFGDTACGTFVAVGSNVFGPETVPAGGSLTGDPGYVPFTPVSQTAATGSGTGADPFKIVTVVDLGTTGLRVTETDSYVVGQESYRTDVTITNNSGSPQAVVVYRAGDCYLQNSDDGFGAVDAATGSVSCVGVMESGGVNVPSSRIEQWRPLTPGSRYFEAGYDEVWAFIATRQPFPNTCRCGDEIDNGAGLSWSATIPAGGSLTFSHLTVFSPTGIQPLGTTKTADVATVGPGGVDGYTITITNPNASVVTVNSISDTLPAGFSYTPGSTTGVTTANPAVSGQTLTWAGPFSVPASGNVTLHFGVTAATAPGTYFNTAGAEAGGFAVAPTGETAPVTVSAGGTSTTTTLPTGSTTLPPGVTTTVPTSATTTTRPSSVTATTLAPGTVNAATTTTRPASPAAGQARGPLSATGADQDLTRVALAVLVLGVAIVRLSGPAYQPPRF